VLVSHCEQFELGVRQYCWYWSGDDALMSIVDTSWHGLTTHSVTASAISMPTRYIILSQCTGCILYILSELLIRDSA